MQQNAVTLRDIWILLRGVTKLLRVNNIVQIFVCVTDGKRFERKRALRLRTDLIIMRLMATTRICTNSANFLWPFSARRT